MTIIPQDYWDDLFDSALATLDTIPVEPDLVCQLWPTNILKLSAYY